MNYLKTVIERDHRAAKRPVRPMPGFTSFRAAAVTLTGNEPRDMIQKIPLRTQAELRPAQQPPVNAMLRRTATLARQSSGLSDLMYLAIKAICSSSRNLRNDGIYPGLPL